MTAGAFRSFEHHHSFEANGSGTRMTDRIRFSAPLGPLGAIAERLFLRSYLQRLVQGRNLVIKQAAEQSSTDAATS